MKEEEVKKVVREGYARIVKMERSCCSDSCSCVEGVSESIGYTQEEIDSAPDGSNLGLGCGNPLALASIKEGETVLDLGSGSGFDCFLAVQRVGRNGKVIGVDMTPEMVERARGIARKEKIENVEFRLGEIENLPLADESVNLVISNCVINLSPNKKRVFEEAFRVLKSGGRIMVSDIALLKELPNFIRNSMTAYVGCVSGAIMKNEYLNVISDAGFQDVEVVEETRYPTELIDLEDPTVQTILYELNISSEQAKEMIENLIDIVSITVNGKKQINLLKKSTN